MGRSRDRRRQRSHRRSRSRRRQRERKSERKHRRHSASRRGRSKSKSPEWSGEWNGNFRFDSPPKQEEVARDQAPSLNPFQQLIPNLQQAMGVLNPQAALQVPMGGQLPMTLQQQLGLPPGAPGTAPLALTAPPVEMDEETKKRMVKVSNLPSQITETQLQLFLNQVAMAMKITESEGEPIKSVQISPETFTAMVEFRTEQEAINAERLSGVELMSVKMRVERANFEEPQPLDSSLPEVQGATGIPGAPPGVGDSVQTGGGNMPTLADMMLTHKEREQQFTGKPMAKPDADTKLALVNVPHFVQEKAISELLGTFGKLKFYRLLSKEEVTDENETIVFFEYFDVIVQNQARAALQGLDLGKQKLSVMSSDEVLTSGKLAQKQKLGDRIVPSRVLYLQNLVKAEDLYEDDEFDEIYNDVKLECENFGTVTSMTIPRPHPGTKIIREMAKRKLEREEQEFKERQARIAKGEIQLAIDDSADVKEDVTDVKMEAEDLDEEKEDEPQDPPGVGFAFVEFFDIEGASKAKKAMNGRKFGLNEVGVEYFSEDHYAQRDFEDIKPNTIMPRDDPEEEIEFIW